jgi:hypothetical protein
MSDNTLTVTEVVNSVTVTPVNNTVEITTGISAGSTTTAGILQLTDSVSSTSTTTAATPNAVKTAYDLAASKPVLKYTSGAYYKTAMTALQAMTAVHQRAYYQPIYISATTTLDRISIQTSSSFVGTSTVRLGIYNESGGLPSTVLLDAGTVSATAASTIYEITISQSLNPGFYFLVFCQQTAPSTASYVGTGAGGSAINFYMLSASTVGGNTVAGFQQNSVTGAFATASSPAIVATIAYVWVRAA